MAAATRYSAVVESGSCSTDYQRWEERRTCGHAHRTYGAAQQCGEKLRNERWVGRSFSCSAEWYNYRIHDQDGHRVSAEEIAGVR